jgi:hypothetical protein
MRRIVVFSMLASSVVSTAVTALIFMLAMPGLVQAQVNTIRADQVIATGANGKDRVLLLPGLGNTGQVEIVDDNGQARVQAILGEGSGLEDVGITLRSASGVPIMRLGTLAQVRELPAPLAHSGNLVLRDESGHDRIRLLVADDGTPTIELINAGDLVWSAP